LFLIRTGYFLLEEFLLSESLLLLLLPCLTTVSFLLPPLFLRAVEPEVDTCSLDLLVLTDPDDD
jgi:hypothetical protein